MPRRSAPSTHPLAAVRAWFGLGQAELALYLGVSQALVHAVETGRCGLGPDGQVALLPLLLQLPPPEARALAEAQAAAEVAAAALPARPPGTPPPDPADLDLRRDECLAQAARLRQQASRLAQQARVAARWATALPALLPPDPAGPPVSVELAAALARRTTPLPYDPVSDPQRPAQHARWLRGWLHTRARPLPPNAATQYARLLARAAGLHAEAEALRLMRNEE